MRKKGQFFSEWKKFKPLHRMDYFEIINISWINFLMKGDKEVQLHPYGYSKLKKRQSNCFHYKVFDRFL